jgi:hypothetical protein
MTYHTITTRTTININIIIVHTKIYVQNIQPPILNVIHAFFMTLLAIHAYIMTLLAIHAYFMTLLAIHAYIVTLLAIHASKSRISNTTFM